MKHPSFVHPDPEPATPHPDIDTGLTGVFSSIQVAALERRLEQHHTDVMDDVLQTLGQHERKMKADTKPDERKMKADAKGAEAKAETETES